MDSEMQLKAGHWYPCINDEFVSKPYYYNGSTFLVSKGDVNNCVNYELMHWVGKSLGEINYGG